MNPRNAAAGSLVPARSRHHRPASAFRPSSPMGWGGAGLGCPILTAASSMRLEVLVCLPACIAATPAAGAGRFHADIRVAHHAALRHRRWYKVDSLELQRTLGFVSCELRWAVAHKYPAQEVKHPPARHRCAGGARTGAVTPVARLEPVLSACDGDQRDLAQPGRDRPQGPCAMATGWWYAAPVM